MTTAELVKRLMDAGANSEVVSICIQAAEDAAAAATEAAKPKRSHRKKPEIRAVK